MAKSDKRIKATNDGGAPRNTNRKLVKSPTVKEEEMNDEDVLRMAVLRNSHYRIRLYGTRTAGIAIMIGAVLYMYLSSKANENDNTNNESIINDIPRIPLIDGPGYPIDDDLQRDNNQTLDFLTNFVCKYRQKDSNTANAAGFCHPKLLAEPQHRTQRVAFANTAVDNHNDDAWWRRIISRFMSIVHVSPSNDIDEGIPAGEFVMRLPRPLQIWDLDALRDEYIQQQFLGFSQHSNDVHDDGTHHDSTVRKQSIVVHTNTRNPLDSGAFLAVHLLRLLHGSLVEEGSYNHADNSDARCISDGGETCNASSQKWTDLSLYHKQRSNELSAYLNILPTNSDRSMESSSHPHDHPCYWPTYIIDSLFPRYTVTNDLIRHYRMMIDSEYNSLKLISADFEANVSFLEYLNMRLNVLSRAFGVSAHTHDSGVSWGNNLEMGLGTTIFDEMRLYETSNFGSSMEDDDDDFEDGIKFRAMCPLLDQYNSHPNPNAEWRYDPNTSSYVVHAPLKRNIPAGHSIIVSYGKYTDGHLFAKYGYINGDGSSSTEVSLAVFHRILGDIGLGRQYSLLPFNLLDPHSHGKILGPVLSDEVNNNSQPDKATTSRTSAFEALAVQYKELLRYLMFDDGYEECINLSIKSMSNSKDEELKLLKLQHLYLIANYRDAWIVRVPPTQPNARPIQANIQLPSNDGVRKIDSKAKVGLNAESVISTCRLLSLIPDDIGGNAIGHLRDGLTSSSSMTFKTRFRLERQDDILEYRAMMCVVRLCNVALGRYSKVDGKEPDAVGSREWNAWYIVRGEIRALGILQQTAANEAHKLKVQGSRSTGTGAALTVREEGACPISYSLPLLKHSLFLT